MSEELETGTESGGMNMDAAVSDIGSSLGFGDGEESGSEEITENSENSDISAESDSETGENTENNETVKSDETPTERSYPQSWAKDKAALWAKTPPDVQDQILFREKQMLDGLDQYRDQVLPHRLVRLLAFRCRIAPLVNKVWKYLFKLLSDKATVALNVFALAFFPVKLAGLQCKNSIKTNIQITDVFFKPLIGNGANCCIGSVNRAAHSDIKTISGCSS